MKKIAIAMSVTLFASTAHAQIATRDDANLNIAKKNADNTKSIMDSNKDILEKSTEILKALSGSRDGSLGIGQMGLGGGMSIAQAPSFGSILNGGALSFGGLSPDIQKIAGTVINGLQLVKQLQQIGNGKSAINSSYSGSVNVAALLSALTSQASQGVTQREQALQSASGSIGQSEDVKGSVDQNTRMQLESARAVNELIGVQNGAVAALNEEMKARLLRQSQVQRMITPQQVNPFQSFGQGGN
ncbi:MULTISPECIES: type IV secretion system protein [Brucella]|uniref:Conjugal transfer protein n=1 Tax=Brucella tritici TaxID=94626 RepID=A0A6L3YCU7_9HYPH|nr:MULTISPECIES: type IV secretion system protein [Brucella]KAB2681169.1 conjugal transfer protein [Brucella tritici]KAB2757349.1 conjugal transfer protein [Brucella anthropi]KAB2775278.1 conjugal transfer protein [Brucella anthropi]